MVKIILVLSMSLLMTGCQSGGVQTAAPSQQAPGPNIPYIKGPTGPPGVKGPSAPPDFGSPSTNSVPQAITETEQKVISAH